MSFSHFLDSSKLEIAIRLCLWIRINDIYIVIGVDQQKWSLEVRDQARLMVQHIFAVSGPFNVETTICLLL